MRTKWIISLVLALGTGILYWPVHRFAFVNYDDVEYVVDNAHLHEGLTFANAKWALTAGYASNWHPLTWLSHMTDVQLFGLDPGAHHVINLLFHIGNTLLLFVVLERMTKAVWPSAMVAALFAWHPLHVESVAWIAERKDVLSTFLALLTLFAYGSYTQSGQRKHFSLAILCFALGLMAKPMLVTLPFIFFLLDYWPLKRQPRLSEKLPFFLLSAASSVVTYTVQRNGGAVATLKNIPFSYRGANALLAYAGYLRRTLIPTDLAVIYPIYSFRWWQVVLAMIILVTISGMALYWMRRRPWLLVGWLWFLGMLVPVIGLVQVGTQTMADRYTYLPLVGIFLILAWGCAEVRSKLVTAGIAAALPILFLLAAVQVRTWHDSESLFQHAIAVTNDNYIAHGNLGRVFVNQGRFDEAQAQFEEVLRIFPNLSEGRFNLSRTHYNSGNALLKRNRPEEAAVHFAAAANLDPSFAEAQNNWAYALTMQGRLREAEEHYNNALRIDPRMAQALLNVARLHEQNTAANPPAHP